MNNSTAKVRKTNDLCRKKSLFNFFAVTLQHETFFTYQQFHSIAVEHPLGLCSLHALSSSVRVSQSLHLPRPESFLCFSSLWCRHHFRHHRHSLHQRFTHDIFPFSTPLQGNKRILHRIALALHHHQHFLHLPQPHRLRLFPIHWQAHHPFRAQRIQQ